MIGALTVVATPIGNLEDITTRAIRALRDADLIACEDTRVSSKLLHVYDVHKPLISVHEHSQGKKIDQIIDEILAGKNIVYMCDAGTPGMNDPGGKLVEAAHAQGIRVIPIPGASALTAAISICGFPMDNFAYVGFVPHKKGRKTFFAELADRAEPVIFLESTHRIEKCLNELVDSLQATRLLCVCRELTKMHEHVYRGTAEEVRQAIKDDDSRGEFTLVIGPKPKL